MWEGANEGYWPFLWFMGKVLGFIFFFIWLRGSLPRLRYDQFMAFGWKVLIPISLVWIVAVATIRAATLEGAIEQRQLLIGVGIFAALTLVHVLLRQRPRRNDEEARGGRVRRLRRRLPGAAAHVGRRTPAPARVRAPTDHRSGEVMATVKETFWDPIAGFGVTFRTMFRKTVTEQYPKEKKATAPRFHGRHQLNRWPDGLEKCIGCELCAWACPADAIYVEGASNTEDERFSPG